MPVSSILLYSFFVVFLLFFAKHNSDNYAFQRIFCAQSFSIKRRTKNYVLNFTLQILSNFLCLRELFNDAVRNSDYIASNVSMITEKGIGKDV